MANIRLVTALWSNLPGMPGTSTFAFDDVAMSLTALKDFYGLLAGILPTPGTIQVQNSGPVVDDTTGDLVSLWSETGVAQTNCSNASAYAAGVGAVVRWDTGQVVDGRLLRGHTYVLPIYGGAYDTDGTLSSSQRTLIQNTATTTVAAYTGKLKVWHRPKKDPVSHAVIRAGSSSFVTGATVPDRVAVLRSRRA